MSSKEKWIKCGWEVKGSKWKLIALVALVFLLFAFSLNEKGFGLGMPAFFIFWFSMALGFGGGSKSGGSGGGSDGGGCGGGGGGCGGGCGG